MRAGPHKGGEGLSLAVLFRTDTNSLSVTKRLLRERRHLAVRVVPPTSPLPFLPLPEYAYFLLGPRQGSIRQWLLRA